MIQESLPQLRLAMLLPLFLLGAIGCQAPAAAITAPTAATTQAKGQGGDQVAKHYSAPPAMTIDPSKTYTANLHTTMGDMHVTLFAKEAPKTVNNFVFLARDGYYSNVKFHRIIKGFMVQTGDPTGTGSGSPGYRFADEPVTRNYSRGIVAMANSGKDTNGSQFFIMHADYGLQKNYTIFGQVTEKADLDVLDKIAAVPVRASATGEMSVPTQDVRITSVEISEQ